MDESIIPPSTQRRTVPLWSEEAAQPRVYFLAPAASRSLRMCEPAALMVVLAAKEGTS